MAHVTCFFQIWAPPLILCVKRNKQTTREREGAWWFQQQKVPPIFRCQCGKFLVELGVESVRCPTCSKDRALRGKHVSHVVSKQGPLRFFFFFLGGGYRMNLGI